MSNRKQDDKLENEPEMLICYATTWNLIDGRKDGISKEDRIAKYKQNTITDIENSLQIYVFSSKEEAGSYSSNRDLYKTPHTTLFPAVFAINVPKSLWDSTPSESQDWEEYLDGLNDFKWQVHFKLLPSSSPHIKYIEAYIPFFGFGETDPDSFSLEEVNQYFTNSRKAPVCKP